MLRKHLLKFLFIVKISYTHCVLKNLGEVTNFSEFLDDKIYGLAKEAIKQYGTVKMTLGPPLPAAGLGIAGGTATFIGDFPHNVIFINYEGMCAGVIISNKLVLTSAHCLDHNQNLLEMRIFAGSRYLFDQTADVHLVWDFMIHAKYNDPIRFSNDAALLIIRDKFRFKNTVQKALLINDKDWIFDNIDVTVAGWGQTDDSSGNTTNKGLLSVRLRYLPYSKCHRLAGTPLSPDMFCLWGDKERATCRGDSGAGAMWNNMVVGLVSHGGACGKYPGIYTNVYYLRPWIQSSSEKLYYKFCRFYAGNYGDY